MAKKKNTSQIKTVTSKKGHSTQKKSSSKLVSPRSRASLSNKKVMDSKELESSSRADSKTKIESKMRKSNPKSVQAEIVDTDNSVELQNVDSREDFIPTELHNPGAESFDDDLLPETTTGINQLALPETTKAITSVDPLVIYLNEIRRYKVLTKEEELGLAKKYFDSKDPDVAQNLVKANLRFVVKIAAEYSKFGAKMIDLIQEGNVGLMHAVREFNPYKGARLITYAVWWIRGYIQEYLMRQYSMVRIGTTQNQRKLFYQLQKEKDALDALGIDSSSALISTRLGIPEDEVRDMANRMTGRDVSLDRPLDDDSGTSLGDIQKNVTDEPLDEYLANQEQLEILKRKIQEIRPELSEREIIILDERLLNDEPLTLQEIGEKHGITREAVRQMEARVLKKIKSKMEAD